MRALWNGKVIAESDDTVLVEGNHYFPDSSVDPAYFTASDKRSSCPWKGEAHYKSLVVDGASNPDAAWYYPTPKDAAANIRNHVAFWKGVTIEE